MKKDNVKNGRLKRSIRLALAMILLAGTMFGLVGCGDKDWSYDFDLSDEKLVCDESSLTDSQYEKVDAILITFKKTKTHRQIDVRDLKMSNIKDLSYIQATLEDGNLGWVEDGNGRQMAQATLKKIGKEKVLETIRHLEKLEFVKSAEPLLSSPMVD